MSEVKEDISQAEEVAPIPARWRTMLQWFTLEKLVANVPYALFLAVLGVLYITNNSKAIALVRSLDQKEAELKELKWEFLDVQSRLMYATSESQLIEAAKVQGLEPLERPPFEIKNTVTIKK